MDDRLDSVPSARSWLPKSLRPRSENKNGQQQDPNTATPDETTTLLPKPDDDEDPEREETFHYDERSRLQKVVSELWILLKASVPVILAYSLQNSLQTISVLIVGRLSPEALATAAFAYMVSKPVENM